MALASHREADRLDPEQRPGQVVDRIVGDAAGCCGRPGCVTPSTEAREGLLRALDAIGQRPAVLAERAAAGVGVDRIFGVAHPVMRGDQLVVVPMLVSSSPMKAKTRVRAGRCADRRACRRIVETIEAMPALLSPVPRPKK